MKDKNCSLDVYDIAKGLKPVHQSRLSHDKRSFYMTIKDQNGALVSWLSRMKES